MLEARELSHSYAGQTVLREFSLALPPGRSVAIVGPNGAGKTTALRCLSGVLTPERGEVTLGGRPIGDLNPREVARSLSVVPQAAPPVFAFTVMEFVLMGLHAQLGRFALESEEHRGAARRALERVRVAELAHRRLDELSGGERQRVVIARTLLSDAKIWLLDEPTNNLDLSHQVGVLDAVAEHCDGGGSAVAILHDLDHAARSFHEVVVMHHGAVVAHGPPEDALDSELLSEVFGVSLRRLSADGRSAWVVG